MTQLLHILLAVLSVWLAIATLCGVAFAYSFFMPRKDNK